MASKPAKKQAHDASVTYLREMGKELNAQREKAEAERDAAIVDLKLLAGCAACKHYCNHSRDHQEALLLVCCDCEKKKNCKCASCRLGYTNWEWRGSPEAPEEGETHGTVNV